MLRVGTDVNTGGYVNSTTPLFNGVAVGNTATATVQVVGDPNYDKTTVIGKVLHDRAGDGWQDPAGATELRLQIELDPVRYIKGSTRIESDYSTRVVAAADVAAMTVSLELGDLPGRSSVSDLPEHHRLDVRAGLYSPQIPALMLQTGEGNCVQVDPDATLHSEHIGDKADGMSGQDIALQRRIIVAERGYELVATTTNYGVEEAAIPGVRLASVSGLLVETDADGHYILPISIQGPGPGA